MPAAWQRQRLGQQQRSRIMAAARWFNRQTYCRGSGKHGGWLKDSGLRVLWQLLYRGWGRQGVCDPSLEQIAEETQLARSTVQEALARLETAGFLRKVRRAVKLACSTWVQVTNAYLFADPASVLADTGKHRALASVVKEKELEWPAPQPISEEERRALLERYGLAGYG